MKIPSIELKMLVKSIKEINEIDHIEDSSSGWVRSTPFLSSSIYILKKNFQEPDKIKEAFEKFCKDLGNKYSELKLELVSEKEIKTSFSEEI